MWTCGKCGEQSDEQFDSCWKCSTPRGEQPSVPPPLEPAPPKWRLTYRYFRGTLATWDQLFTQAADFANHVGTDKVLNISHSCDDDDGVVTVWYLTDEPPEPQRS